MVNAGRPTQPIQIDNSQMEAESSQDSIQVLIRIKPEQGDSALNYAGNEVEIDRHRFAFDRVFPPNASQQDIFEAVGRGVVQNCLDGFNSSVLAYGQTGSGKTYTMTELMGRSFRELFARIGRRGQVEFTVSCSYCELYNEKIFDLLDVNKERKTTDQIREEKLASAEQLMDCLTTGINYRHTGKTQMNQESSRSHSIFTVYLKMQSEEAGRKTLKSSKLQFVDLAGSERQKMTKASGERLKEAGNINKSLTSLGMVVNALASDKTHVPYRDSKLTWMLKDSLGGNSKTFIVATLAQSALCFQETLSTLHFANRAKMVKVKAIVNEESLSGNIEVFKEEIRRLKMEIARLKSERRAPAEEGVSSIVSKTGAELEHKYEDISSRMGELRETMGKCSIEKLASALKQTQQAEMEAEGQEQDGELLEYMVSNHQLLKGIHGSVQQYNELREEELRARIAEVRELQELCENERRLRVRAESELQEQTRKERQFESLRRQLSEEWEEKMYDVEAKWAESERREQESRRQLEIMSSTLEFNNRKMQEYSTRLAQMEHQSVVERNEWAARRAQLEEQVSTLQAERSALTQNKEVETKQRQEIEQEYSRIKQEHATVQVSYEQLQQTHKERVGELQKGWASARQAAQQHEQLKSSYKDTIRQNYKLKGEYYNSSSSAVAESAKNEELLAKVAFYQEKFRLMSIEYNKAQKHTQHLKATELQLKKRVEFLEESKRVQSMQQAQPEGARQALASVQAENKELKEAMARTKALNETLMRCEQKEEYSKRVSVENERYELQQREERLRKRLEGSIRSWEPAKENACEGMSLDELLDSWEKVEGESRRKLEGIARGIRRQQKLKSQNKFILKENFYLKEKLEAVQRQLSSSESGERPRKLHKADSQCSSANKWE